MAELKDGELVKQHEDRSNPVPHKLTAFCPACSKTWSINRLKTIKEYLTS